jgi:predicted RNase H-like HicB family nuclease
MAVDTEDRRMEITYDVVIAKAPEGFSAYVPDLDGCTGHGDTESEALASIRTSIELYLEVLRENGEEVPQPTRHAFERVTVAA